MSQTKFYPRKVQTLARWREQTLDPDSPTAWTLPLSTRPLLFPPSSDAPSSSLIGSQDLSGARLPALAGFLVAHACLLICTWLGFADDSHRLIFLDISLITKLLRVSPVSPNSQHRRVLTSQPHATERLMALEPRQCPASAGLRMSS